MAIVKRFPLHSCHPSCWRQVDPAIHGRDPEPLAVPPPQTGGGRLRGGAVDRGGERPDAQQPSDARHERMNAAGRAGRPRRASHGGRPTAGVVALARAEAPCDRLCLTTRNWSRNARWSVRRGSGHRCRRSPGPRRFGWSARCVRPPSRRARASVAARPHRFCLTESTAPRDRHP